MKQFLKDTIQNFIAVTLFTTFFLLIFLLFTVNLTMDINHLKDKHYNDSTERVHFEFRLKKNF